MMEVFWNDLARNAAELISPLNRSHPVDGKGLQQDLTGKRDECSLQRAGRISLRELRPSSLPWPRPGSVVFANEDEVYRRSFG